MLIYDLAGNKIDSIDLNGNELPVEIPYIGVLNKNESEGWNPGIDIMFLEDCLDDSVSKFESHDGFDCISLALPNKENLLCKGSGISIFFRKNLLVFIYSEMYNYELIQSVISKIVKKEIVNISLERVLFEFFDLLTADDSLYLESLEQEIAELEESLMMSKKKDYIKEIITFRKHLLVLKRYYEQLFDLAEAMEENENGLLSHRAVKYFHFLTARADRLSDAISNLRDYVSQVREAYQTDVEITQNNIMRLFTVITAIFLPLTLIVGWYGMNFSMPEYLWAYGYPVVIVICVTVALSSIIYFKKHKWF